MTAAADLAAVSIREFDIVRRRELVRRTAPFQVGAAITVGREAGLLIGVEPPDPGVSRIALSAVYVDDLWRLVVRNRNGAVVHPWGQPAQWVDPEGVLDGRWQRLGVRLVGSEPGVEHWVLLRSPTVRAPLPDQASQERGPTRRPDTPKPLTPAQLAAVHAVFREFLAWPPVSGAAPVPLAAAANRLGISPTALQERLSRVQERAYSLGLHRHIGVSDPGYVYLLVRRGYIGPSNAGRPDHA